MSKRDNRPLMVNKQSERARGEKVRSIELINTHKGDTLWTPRSIFSAGHILRDIHIRLCGKRVKRWMCIAICILERLRVGTQGK